MCMPTNFQIRKKYNSKFQRSIKKVEKKHQKDEFFKNCEEFLKDTKKEK